MFPSLFGCLCLCVYVFDLLRNFFACTPSVSLGCDSIRTVQLELLSFGKQAIVETVRDLGDKDAVAPCDHQRQITAMLPAHGDIVVAIPFFRPLFSSILLLPASYLRVFRSKRGSQQNVIPVFVRGRDRSIERVAEEVANNTYYWNVGI